MNEDRSLNIGDRRGKPGHQPSAKTDKPQGEMPQQPEKKPNSLPGEKRNGDTGHRQGGNIAGS